MSVKTLLDTLLPKSMTPKEAQELIPDLTLIDPASTTDFKTMLTNNTLIPTKLTYKTVHDSDSRHYHDYDDCPVFLRNRSENTIDINATYEALIRIGGYSPEQAREQIDRYAAWERDRWQYCGIVVTAYGLTPKELSHNATCKYTNDHELTSDSLWGIESDTSHEHVKEVLDDLCHQVRLALLDDGFTAEQFDQLQLEESEDTEVFLDNYPKDRSTERLSVDPLPEFPSYPRTK